MLTIALEDSVDKAVVQGVLEILVLYVMVKVVIETGIVDSVYVDMSMSLREGLSEEKVMPLSVHGMSRVKIF